MCAACFAAMIAADTGHSSPECSQSYRTGKCTSAATGADFPNVQLAINFDRSLPYVPVNRSDESTPLYMVSAPSGTGKEGIVQQRVLQRMFCNPDDFPQAGVKAAEFFKA